MKPKPIMQDIRPASRGRRTWRQLGRHQKIVAGLLLVALVAAAGLFWWLEHRSDQPIKTGQYQVVFLQTGQVFIGKLQNTHGQYLMMKDVYYTRRPVDASTDKTTITQPTQLTPVIKESYAPEDSMAIRADQVMFWQNLTADSPVVKALTTKTTP